MVFLGYKLPLQLPSIQLPRITVRPDYFYVSLVFSSSVFVFYSFYSFGGVPLVQTLLGDGNPDVLRGELYKGREGFEIVLLYLSSIFTYVFFPLAVLVSFRFKYKSRIFFLIFGVLYTIVTLQKALMLNILVPLVAYFLLTGYWRGRTLLKFTLLLVGYFIVMILLTGHGEGGDNSCTASVKDFFSSSFTPCGGLEYFIWRVFSVPIYTAVDTLYVYINILGEMNTMGGTSSLFSWLFGVEKIELEKLVFEYQFGGYNPLANANANFAVVLYVDFWLWGLALGSFFLGLTFRLLESSKDVLIISLGYLLAMHVLNAPLIGLFFSSGFLYVIFHSLFIRFKY
jgi:hypothetical protein